MKGQIENTSRRSKVDAVESFSRRSFLLSAYSATLLLLLENFRRPKLARAEGESTSESLAKDRVTTYLSNAAKYGVYIRTPSDQGTFSYIDFQQLLEGWGIIDGQPLTSAIDETPLFAKIADDMGLKHLPIEIHSSSGLSPLPAFDYKGITWHYEELVKTQGIEPATTVYQLLGSDGTHFHDYFGADTLQDAVAVTDWRSITASTSEQSQQVFELIRSKKLFDPQSCFFVATDGSHPSDPPTEFHQVYPTQSIGVGEVRMSRIGLHPTVVPTAAQVLLGTTEARRITMEKNDLINTFLTARVAEVDLAELEGRTLPVGIVCYPNTIGVQQLLDALKQLDAEQDLERLRLLFVVTTSNEDTEIGIDFSESRFVFAVTSSEKARGIVPRDKSAGRMFEWPEAVPGMEALPVLSEKQDDFEIAWKFRPLIAPGVSFSCWQLCYVLGSIVSVLSANGQQPSMAEIEKVVFSVFPVQNKLRDDKLYQVRSLSMFEFNSVINHFDYRLYLSQLDTGGD